MKFVFKARTREGAQKEGVIDAADKMAAIDLLQENHLFPISVDEEAVSRSFTKSIMRYFDQVTAKEQMVFFRQLAILIEAKVPIVSALNSIKDQADNPYFRKVIEEIVNDINDGLPLSDAMKKHKNVFSHLSVSIIKSGEISGNLKKAVGYVASNIEKNYNLTSRVKSAMMYPMVVLAVFGVIAFIVAAFVIPKLTQMIKDLQVEVPWYTKVVIWVGDFMTSYWWAAAIVIMGAVGGAAYYLNTEEGKSEWDQIKIKLPIVGVIFRNVYIARFGDNLSVLLSGGIPIIKALTVVSAVINNGVYEKILLRAADEVKTGGNMSDALKKYKEIPPIVTQMVKIGEESGQVDSVLKYIADFYEGEVNQATANLSTLIEPLLMVVIGIAVGVLAFSVIMPIYNVAGQL